MASATESPAPLIVVPPTTPREQLPDQQVLQVLNRLGYGPRPGDVEKVRAMGVDNWIALQLTPERIDDHAADSVIAADYPALDTPTSDMVVASRDAQEARRREQLKLRNDGDTASKRDVRKAALQDDPQLRDLQRRVQEPVNELVSAKMARAVISDRQLQEVMVDFWENHFSVYVAKAQTRLYLNAYDRDVIRPHALGKFRDLLGAVAHSPAMLYYLDNWESQADSTHATLAAVQNRNRVARAPQRGVRFPNPLARPNPNANRLPPSMQDLPPEQRERVLQQQAARRGRGLNENYARELMELHTLGVDGGYTQHDVIEVARCLTGWTIDQRNGTFVFRPQMHDADTKYVLGHEIPAGRGEEDGEEVLDILAHHPSTAHFIAKKLVVRFVSDSAPPALVERAAQTFLRTDGDIREVVRTIVTSPEFFSRAAYRAKVKTPFELVASALRAMNAQPDPTPRVAGIVQRLGQQTFGRLTPDGWPDRGDAWMNTGAILNRINFGVQLANGGVPGAPFRNWPYATTLRTASHEEQVDGVVKAILGGEVSQVTRNVLMTGENPLLKKAQSDSATNAPMFTPSNGMPGLQQVVGLALGAPEFQRR
ncbi:MAG TPA: DUF1800 domain-containing protein [Gemmatimonadaceae bacterium]|nr:DUF1800 domain-containing protein [Gemmatimonadaceae bacterium]